MVGITFHMEIYELNRWKMRYPGTTTKLDEKFKQNIDWNKTLIETKHWLKHVKLITAMNQWVSANQFGCFGTIDLQLYQMYGQVRPESTYLWAQILFCSNNRSEMLPN